MKGTDVGAFSDSKCTEEAVDHNGKYEWEPGLVKGGVTFVGTGASFKSARSAPVSCGGQNAGGGMVVGAESIDLALRFTGCKDEITGTPACTTPGLPEGTMETTGLQGQLGFLTRSPTTVGLALSAHGEEPWLLTGCPGSVTSVWGSLLDKVKVDHMGRELALDLKAKKGLQQYSRFEGGPLQVLHIDEPEGEELALQTKAEIIFEEKAEIKAIP